MHLQNRCFKLGLVVAVASASSLAGASHASALDWALQKTCSSGQQVVVTVSHKQTVTVYGTAGDYVPSARQYGFKTTMSGSGTHSWYTGRERVVWNVERGAADSGTSSARCVTYY